MPKPRKQLVSLEATPYYNCVSRCVRRAFLCGTDSEGHSFEHRRGWIEKLILDQAQGFCIDIAAYAVMSNHFHIVLHVSQQCAQSLTNPEVVQRWHQLYAGNPRQDMPEGIQMRLTDYLDLVDWTGRQIRENKRGSISEAEPAIMDRLGIDAEHWLYITQNFESEFKGIVGAVHEIKSKMSQFWDGQRERRRAAGIAACKLRLS